MWLTRLSILRPVTIIMLVLAIIVLGLTSLQKLPVDLYPKIDIPWVTVVSVYSGAGPQEIETLVSKPIEDSVSTISGLKNVTSTSSEGVSTVGIEFELGTDLNTATNDVREKLDAARMDLPRDMDPPVIQKFSISAIPVIDLTLASPMPSKELRRITGDVIKDRLGKLKGVGAVNVYGGDVREILVAVDKRALEGYGLGINDVVQALQATNLNLPSGSIKEGRREYAVRAVGEYATPQDVGDTTLRTRTGALVYLRDVAEVTDTVAERDSYARMDGVDTVAVTVMKQSDANTVSVADAVRNELMALTGQTFNSEGKEVKGVARKPGILPPNIDARITNDQSIFIRHTLSDVKMHLIIGSLFAVLIVFLFLHNLRGTLIVAFAIPTSIIATFGPMYFAGFSLNMMTMMGLSLCVGILVDDSIVVIENIYRHLRLGEKPRDAALSGRTEIGLAAITITTVDVVVFVPIAFMGGIVGQIFRQFGLTVAIATLFSLFVSFTLTPMLSSRWFREAEAVPSEEEYEGRRGFYAWFDRRYAGLHRGYRRLLGWALVHRLVTVTIGVVSLLACIGIAVPWPASIASLPLGVAVRTILTSKVGVLAVIALLSLAGVVFGGKGGRLAMLAVGVASLLVAGLAYKMLAFEMFPRVDQGQISISVELPAGSSLAATDGVVRRLEGFIRDEKRFPELDSVFSNVGTSGAANASMSVVLVDKLERKRSDLQVVEAIDKFARTIPGAIIKTSASGGMEEHGGAPISIELSGSDMNDLVRVAERIKRRVATVEGTLNVDTTWRVGKPELRAEIDRDRAADRGVTTWQVASALRTSLEGDTTSKYREGSDQYDIRVRLREEDRQRLDEITHLVVGYGSGPVYLGDVAKVSMSTGPTKIDRKNRQRMVAVQSDLQRGYAEGNVGQAIQKEIADIPLGKASLFYGGESEIRRESFGSTNQALMLSVVLIYILMAALFEGYLSPLIIMFALPMALVGALLAMIITGKSLSIITMIGIIMLMGLVGKNAILLVDYTNTLRARGYARREAILEAGPTRLRPILMTTLAMIFGMSPVAFAVARGAEMRQPMAIAVIGGLIVSTMLTLLVIPVLYTVFDGVAEFFTGVMRSVLKRVFP